MKDIINEIMYYCDEFSYVTIIFCDDTILRLTDLYELRDFLITYLKD